MAQLDLSIERPPKMENRGEVGEGPVATATSLKKHEEENVIKNKKPKMDSKRQNY